jgi:hypothetical protein
MKDAYRYHKKSKKPKVRKSGESASDNDDEYNEEEQEAPDVDSWPMYEHLKFLDDKPSAG